MGDVAAAPLDPDALAAALRPFGSSRTLPAQAYLDGAILAWERRHLFAGAWTCVNWKVIVENYQECYHCPLIHPELCRVSPPTSGDNWTLPGAWVGGTMDLRPHSETMSMDGKGCGVFIDGTPDPVRALAAACTVAGDEPAG